MERRRSDSQAWDRQLKCPKRALVDSLVATMDPDEREEFLRNIRQEEAA